MGEGEREIFFALVDTSTTCLFMPCMPEDSPGIPVI